MLKISNLNVFYGLIHALKGIDIEVKENEIVALIGANGAGKTTLLQTISGLIKAKEGEIIYLDQDLRLNSTMKIVSSGLVQVPEGRRIFPAMSVHENLIIGATLRKDKIEIEKDLQMVYNKFPRLNERKKQLAGTLSGGEQQMLAMGRALMARPKLLLLDEPSMGLSPLLVKEIFSIIEEINENNTTILLVEQNAKMALKIAHRAYVIENGQIVLSDDAEKIMNSEVVQKAYLGG